MIHKKQITQFAKNLLRSQKGIKNHQLMHPSREWAVGLLVAVGIFTGSGVWSALAYLEYRSDNLLVEDVSSEQPVVYREALVTEALNTFNQKEETLAALLDDPSLETEQISQPNATNTVPVTPIATSTATSSESMPGAASTTPQSEELTPESSEVNTNSSEPQDSSDPDPQEDQSEDLQTQPLLVQ